jgi:hypothetical protein
VRKLPNVRRELPRPVVGRERRNLTLLLQDDDVPAHVVQKPRELVISGELLQLPAGCGEEPAKIGVRAPPSLWTSSGKSFLKVRLFPTNSTRTPLRPLGASSRSPPATGLNTLRARPSLTSPA